MSLLPLHPQVCVASWQTKTKQLAIAIGGSTTVEASELRLVRKIPSNYIDDESAPPGGANIVYSLMAVRKPTNTENSKMVNRIFIDTQEPLNGSTRKRAESLRVFVAGRSGLPEPIEVAIKADLTFTITTPNGMIDADLQETTKPVPTPAPAPTPSPAVTAPPVQKIVQDEKFDVSGASRAIPTMLPTGKNFIRLMAPAADAASTKYDVDLRLQNDSLKVWRAGLSGGQLYWDLMWAANAAAQVQTMVNVVTTKSQAASTVTYLVINIGAVG